MSLINYSWRRHWTAASSEAAVQMPTLTSDFFVEVENKNVTGDAQANTIKKNKKGYAN